MEARYILDAVEVLKECEIYLSSGNPSPETCGRLSAKAFCAANALLIYSGLTRAEVEIEVNVDQLREAGL